MWPGSQAQVDGEVFQPEGVLEEARKAENIQLRHADLTSTKLEGRLAVLIVMLSIQDFSDGFEVEMSSYSVAKTTSQIKKKSPSGTIRIFGG